MATRTVPYRVAWGIGAGAGAALAMIVAMGLLRFTLQFPTLPELMLNTIVKLMGGQAFSNALDTLYYAGRPLLFTIILEGTLLLGAILGVLYAWLARPNRATGRRAPIFRSPFGGLLYGLLIGLLLNTVFLMVVEQPVFADRAYGIYSQSVLPLWAGLVLLALVFGLVLHLLLPRVSPELIPAGGQTVVDSATARATKKGDVGRRQFLKVAAGTALAAIGGLAFWYGGTVLSQGGFTSPVNRTASDGPVQSQDPAETPTPQSAAQVRPTETAQLLPTETPPPTEQPTVEPTAEPTAPPTPETAAEAPAATAEPPAPTDTAQPVAQPKPTPAPILQTVPEIKVPEITPTLAFYKVSKNFFDPSPSEVGWKLEITGLVSKPYSLTYSELTSMPALQVVTGMMCISNPIGGALIGNARWKGVRLGDLIKKAGAKRGVVDVVMRGLDGYSDSISLQKALDPNVMLVWEMNGATLNADHGFPARVLVPGIYGMKHMKWINQIELVDYDFKGFWQQPDQGWSDPAPVHTMSRIDLPVEGVLKGKKHTISGVAFAGDRSIGKVEVSTDGGNTWVEAYVKPPLSGTSWAVWGYDWTPPGPGKYQVRVRATDGKGKLQSAKRADPYPNGATGYHTVTYTVRA